MFCLIFLILLCLIVAIKLVSMSYFGIFWNYKYGQNYYDFLCANKLDKQAFQLAKIKFNKNPIGLGKWILKRKNFLTKLIYFLYRFPTLFFITSLTITLFIYFEKKKEYILILIFIIILCLFIQIALRYSSRLYLGKFADIDESVYAGIPPDSISEVWLNSLAFRRTIFLFLADILILLFCYSFIYLGLQYFFKGNPLGNALIGVEGNLCFSQWIDMVYFTIVTFSTTGFGDIYPNKFTLVRFITGIQIFIGFLHIVGLILLLSLTTRAEPIRNQ